MYLTHLGGRGEQHNFTVGPFTPFISPHRRLVGLCGSEVNEHARYTTAANPGGCAHVCSDKHPASQVARVIIFESPRTTEPPGSSIHIVYILHLLRKLTQMFKTCGFKLPYNIGPFPDKPPTFVTFILKIVCLFSGTYHCQLLCMVINNNIY